ncbi:class I glutamine amidotransferase-like protein [Terfezia boudieri ATCC MYA-4762]|uniref:Class I glutamine amidotransferase-like protein n=1 Tax=Terfezia boudieri ATCC MYA-4762 TaxID=1051890 RepID=A0A3N4LVY3_9PEZI|nr:class I glutamine amidotransferase-like protein [Terfezia boudieri ATCC MYA-4762]
MASALQKPPCAPVPKKIGVVLFPTFQTLDVAGPLDAFQWLSNYVPDLKLYLLANTLDPVSTKFSETVFPGSHTSDFGLSIVPTHTFDNAPQDIDVLFVPGGYGVMACGAAGDKVLNPVRAFIKERFPKVMYLLTVCTGSGLVAQTGVLDGYKATSNKAAWDWVTKQSQKVNWQPVARWTVDGKKDKGDRVDKVWTSSGVQAGMDMALAWITRVYQSYNPKPEDLGTTIATTEEYVRDLDPSRDPFAKKLCRGWD